MSSTSLCAALQVDKQNPDLRTLRDVAGEIVWVSEESAESAPSPLVVRGDWAATHPDRASQLFAARSSDGRHTIVVPKFRPGVWTKILGAPTKVEVIASEFRSFEWHTVHHSVPGFVVFRSSLHAAKWGQAPGLGVVVLGYRPTLSAGVVVLCAAVLTAKVMGVALSAQQALYRSIVDVIAAPVARDYRSVESEPTTISSTVTEFLQQEGELGAAFLLCRLVASETCAENVVEAAKSTLGLILDPDRVSRLSARLPANATAMEVRAALQRQGWGAYLRRLIDFRRP